MISKLTIWSSLIYCLPTFDLERSIQANRYGIQFSVTSSSVTSVPSTESADVFSFRWRNSVLVFGSVVPLLVSTVLVDCNG